MIIIKVFTNGKILSIEIILSMHTHIHTHTTCPPTPTPHTHTCTHKYTDHSKLKQTTNRDFRRRQTPAWNGKTWQLGLLFWKNKCLGLVWSRPRRLLSERKSKTIPCRGGKRLNRHGNQHWKVCYKESGSWEYQKQSGKVRKFEDSHNIQRNRGPTA